MQRKLVDDGVCFDDAARFCGVGVIFLEKKHSLMRVLFLRAKRGEIKTDGTTAHGIVHV